MTSGALLANMYELTVGQAVLTAALGAAIALNAAALTRAMRARRVCAARAGGAAAAAGTGLLAAGLAANWLRLRRAAAAG